MALSTLRTNLSGLFKTKDTVPAENPQLYLKLTSKCTKQADRMVSLGAATSPKFNQEQCKYLVDKLKVAVQSAHFFFEPINTWYSKYASDEDRALSLEIFKLLFVLGKEVESFVQDCSKDAWVQSAIMLTNVSEHTLCLSFDLEFCKIVFLSKNLAFGAIPTVSVAEVIASISKAEGEIVKEKFNQDQLRLCDDVSALIQSSRASSADRQQATFLLERLRSPRMHLNANSLESDQSSCPEISMSSLKQIQVLGTGAFGIVHKANWLGTEVARKTFHGPSAPEFKQEVKILDGLCHPNIVSLFWHTRDERKCYMIMELMDGDLYSLMQKRLEECGTRDPPFNISEEIHIMLQVAEGMLFLHDNQIVHRDLKSHNILVKQIKANEVEINYVQAKVADFGLSRTKERSMTYTNQTQNQGTTRWMAPEMIKIVKEDGQAEVSKVDGELKYPFKVDVYSFGMVCFEVLTGDVPFPTLSSHEVKIKVLEGARPQLPDQCPDKLRNLIEACWSSEPKKRPRFGDICTELRHLKCADLITSAWASEKKRSNGLGHLIRFFSYKELDHATQGFSKWFARGYHGTLYKGNLADGQMVVVKNPSGIQSTQQFLNKVEVLSKVRLPHRDMVTLLGCCVERPLLVYKNAPNIYWALLLD